MGYNDIQWTIVYLCNLFKISFYYSLRFNKKSVKKTCESQPIAVDKLFP